MARDKAIDVSKRLPTEQQAEEKQGTERRGQLCEAAAHPRTLFTPPGLKALVELQD